MTTAERRLTAGNQEELEALLPAVKRLAVAVNSNLSSIRVIQDKGGRPIYRLHRNSATLTLDIDDYADLIKAIKLLDSSDAVTRFMIESGRLVINVYPMSYQD